jgi:acetyl-CoA acetyltransferase
MTSGITAWGAYIPRPRLERSAIASAHQWVAPSLKGLAKGRRAYCSWDEDIVTMAVEAARNCLPKLNRKTVREVRLASTNQWDGSYVRNTRNAAAKAYKEAGIKDPKSQLSLIEVHDCFSITELVTMEDLFLSEDGHAVTDILDGFYDRNGKVPCQVDGGLKCFGHPIGASGLRMVYEIYNQLLGRAGERQLPNVSLGLTHNLGGVPYLGVAAVAVIGLH